MEDETVGIHCRLARGPGKLVLPSPFETTEVMTVGEDLRWRDPSSLACAL